jgi:adenylate cyclase
VTRKRHAPRSRSTSPVAADEEAGRPPAREVLEELDRVLADACFDASTRSRDFLRFVVRRALEGATSIPQREIAEAVFGRGPGFEPSSDPIVRIQAGRVRRALDRYYRDAGRDDPLRIGIPRGRYLPVFSPRAATTTPAEEPEDVWPVLAVAPLENVTGDAQLDFIARGMSSALWNELGRYREIRSVPLPDTRHTVPNARFRTEGEVRRERDGFAVSIRLLDLASGQLLYAQSFSPPASETLPTFFETETAGCIAACIAEERGVLHRALLGQARAHSPRDSSVYEAILRYYAFEADNAQGTLLEAQRALESAVARDPACGLARMQLARVYATIYGLGHPRQGFSTDETRAAALQLATDARQLDPTEPRARAILGYVHLLAGDVAAGLREANAALALTSPSSFFADGIGYLLVLLGDRERGVELIRRAIRTNPCYRPIVHFALWLDAVRRGDYAASYDEALQCRGSVDLWEPLAMAASLQLLGRKAEARRHARQLLAVRPDFPQHARWLIERYVKHGPLVELLLDTLGRAGVDRVRTHSAA